MMKSLEWTNVNYPCSLLESLLSFLFLFLLLYDRVLTFVDGFRMAQKRVKINDETKKDDHEPNTVVIDRLSALPDAVIHHILSFIPTIDGVQMSLFSKHWWHVEICPYIMLLWFGFS